MKKLIVIAVAAGVLLGAFGFGALWSHKKLWPYELIRQNDWAVMFKRSVAGSNQPVRQVRSAFSDFKVKMFDMNVAVSNRIERGGVDAIGNALLIMDNRGRFYWYTREDGGSVETMALEIDNNYDALRESGIQFVGHIEDHFGFIDVLTVDEPGQRAVLASGLHYHPDDACLTVRVSKLPVADGVPFSDATGAPEDWQPLYDSAPCLPFEAGPFLELSGGRIALDQAGGLIVTVGSLDRHKAYEGLPHAQDPAVDYGKVIRVDLQTGEAQQLAMGHRNLQGLAVDDQGRIWTTEHGPKGGDELNLIEPGENHGYPFAVYGTDYGAKSWPLAEKQGFHDGYDRPFYNWTPSVGLSNVIQDRGSIPEWEGDLLVSSMKAKNIYRIRVREGRAVFAEPIEFGIRVRDLDQFEDGTIVIWTDTHIVAELEPIEAREGIPQEVFAGIGEGERGAIELAIKQCQTCHEAEPNANVAAAPNLWGVYGREIGRSAYATYSSALANHGGRWDDASLDAYLKDPSAFAPGTTMAIAGISDDAQRAAVIRYLKTLQQRQR